MNKGADVPVIDAGAHRSTSLINEATYGRRSWSSMFGSLSFRTTAAISACARACTSGYRVMACMNALRMAVV